MELEVRVLGRSVRSSAIRPFVGVVVAVVAACANAPTSPDDGSQPNRIVIQDPGGALRAHESLLRETLEATLARVVEVLPMTGLTITVSPNAARAIGGYGIGGFTTDGRTVDLFIDPAFPNLAAVLAARVAPMLAHEAHHAARFRGPGYGRTLLEAMVSEGMADHFAIELLGAAVPPWSDALAANETDAWLAQARPLFDSVAYGHERWFFGTTPEIPRWVGYTLGYRLIDRYKQTHPGSTAVALVNTPANIFRP
jgi:hypothetical protein